MPKQPFRYPTCVICGEPLYARHGKMHERCRPDAGLPQNKGKDWINVFVAHNRIKQEVDALMVTRTKHWNVSMGRKRLEQMFPDLANRV